MNAVEQKKAIKGGEFLIRETQAQEVFIPEDFNEEQKMIAQTCKDFLKQEIHPRLDEIDSMKNPELMPQLMDKAGELGLLGTSVPQELGGFGMDFNTTMLVAEVLGAQVIHLLWLFRHIPVLVHSDSILW
jgi:alkylation response protein AidB-like acyl-CoA dehydrogenase